MNENQARQSNMIETTDCLEAVGVFRAWKNFLFVIVVICLLLLQTSFWIVNTDLIKVADKAESTNTVTPTEDSPAAIIQHEEKEPAVPLGDKETKQLSEEADKIEEAAQKIVTTQSAGSMNEGEQKGQDGSFLGVKIQHIELTIKVCNFVLLAAAGLYCLTVLFSLKISLVGRLGGINHISRAFLLSLIMVFLLVPWQKAFGRILVGAIYTPEELLNWCSVKSDSTLKIILYYLRFTGYWFLVLLLLVLAQIRSSRWTKAVLKRLEIM
jgi:hypothetical protein